MATLYRGNKTLYQEDSTGEIWDSEQKRVRFNDDGSPFDGKIVVPPKVEKKEEEKEEVVVNEFVCDTCGFIAKNNAGLAVHKMKHNTEQHED